MNENRDHQEAKPSNESNKGDGTFSKSRRSFRNIALQPLLQMKLGLYCILLSVSFAAIMGYIVYVNLSEAFVIMLELTGVEADAKGLIFDHLEPVKSQVALTSFVYILCTILLSIIFTHRMVGPTIAFRRHVKKISEGDFSYRTVLRTGDAFEELASDLNNLSAKFESNKRDL